MVWEPCVMHRVDGIDQYGACGGPDHCYKPASSTMVLSAFPHCALHREGDEKAKSLNKPHQWVVGMHTSGDLTFAGDLPPPQAASISGRWLQGHHSHLPVQQAVAFLRQHRLQGVVHEHGEEGRVIQQIQPLIDGIPAEVRVVRPYCVHQGSQQQSPLGGVVHRSGATT